MIGGASSSAHRLADMTSAQIDSGPVPMSSSGQEEGAWANPGPITRSTGRSR